MKYTVLNGNFVLGLHAIYHECNPGVKQDLTVVYQSDVTCKLSATKEKKETFYF